MRIGLGQLNPIVGDLQGNAEKMKQYYNRALEQHVDMLVFPELSICGYPPEDLLFKKHFLDDNLKAVEKLANDCPEISIIVGFAHLENNCRYNSAAVLRKGRIDRIYHKGLLPNYGVFDEPRYFKEGNKPVTINVCDIKIAVTICADIWDIDWLDGFLNKVKPVDLVLNISASPFHLGKIHTREDVVSLCAKKFNSAVIYCNLIGGQDELVFDGRSILTDSSGRTVAKAKAFEEDLFVADIESTSGNVTIKPVSQEMKKPINQLDEAYHALVLGTRDYINKNRFKKVLIGLSGGIDSSLVAAIAAEATGPKNVIGITMPSKFNSDATKSDAQKLAENLGIDFKTIPIQPILEIFNTELSCIPGWDDRGIAYENLQARIRGSILMSLSNQFGALVLTTGNKSETAVGYATLYGDTAGGFAVIKDVPKTLVYKLAEHINRIKEHEIIPNDVIVRPPSAELREDQKDTDSLPDYDLLDAILKGYVEEDKSARQLIDSELPSDQVVRVMKMVDRNEYKRRQSPPGVKITPKAFGKDRRLPITNRYTSTLLNPAQ